MPATVTLSTTTLQANVNATSREIKVASTSGLASGIRLYLDKELMSVVSLGVSTSLYSTVEVRRGVDGTTAVPHESGQTLYVGRGDQFYDSDPKGLPPLAVPVSPYINVITGDFWFAQGDGDPLNGSGRWWQRASTTYGVGALGVRTTTQDPTAST